VLTVEYKLNLMSPAEGDLLVARGRVVRAGRTLTVCEATVAAVRHRAEVPCAIMLATMIRRG
jgi:acyl-coenzyme A thioesterase PaaI-like protein